MRKKTKANEKKEVGTILKEIMESIMTKKEALRFLVNAGIYTQKGNLRKPYKSK